MDTRPINGALIEATPEKPEGSCMELALEGERLCKSGDCRTGVQFFEAAVQVGTDDLKTLGAIYSQLGNAYFYLQEYAKAMEYHKHDLNLARTIGDRIGEAKASGNLGNTFKVLGKFSEAIACCQRHLDISRELGDRIGEARALYNLGNVHHAKGKHAGRSANQDPGDFPPEVKQSLQKAAQFYEANLSIVRELGDRAAQGRACGNLGNTHYLLGNFSTAIRFHEERLAIAREFGDKAAERRAYSNLGNAHIFLGEFDVAADHYKKTLQIARQLGDRALEAQACYSLGNTYTLLKDYQRAIDYHIQHLKIAMELRDRVGEGRACWSLGNAHASLGNHEKALQYASKHLEISREIGDKTGQVTAQMNLTDLKAILGISSGKTDNDSLLSESGEQDTDLMNKRPARHRRLSMEQMELVKLTPDKQGIPPHKGARPKPPKVQKALSLSGDTTEKHGPINKEKRASSVKEKYTERSLDDDLFFDLLSRSQSRRIDDQRCSFDVIVDTGSSHGSGSRGSHGNDSENKENTSPSRVGVSGGASTIAGDQVFTPPPQVPPPQPIRRPNDAHADEFLDMVAGIQGSRMNDQRAHLPEFPGLNNQEAVIGPLLNNRQPAAVRGSNLDDQFFEMLMRCQSSRIDEQRSALPQNEAPTVPDEDFFTLIQRVQSNRLDEQRSAIPDPLRSHRQQPHPLETPGVKTPATGGAKRGSKKAKDKK